MIDDLDRILAADEPLEPSPGFAAAVLAQVREAAAAPPPLRFPWLRFLAGVAGMTVLAGLGEWIVVALDLPAALGGVWKVLAGAWRVLAAPPAAPALGTAAGALAGTYLFFRLTLELTGVRR